MNSIVEDAPPILRQRWEHLLFLHWPVASDVLLPHLPPGLVLDTFDGRAWLSMTPFAVAATRASGGFPLSMLGDGRELDFRTYVRAGGVHGIWFLSIDMSNLFAVAAARMGASLPYHLARSGLRVDGAAHRFASRRVRLFGAPADCDVAWRRGEPLPSPEPQSLEHFLVERYWHYTVHGGRLMRGRIEHEPWPLRSVEIESFSSTLFAAAGLPAPDGEPLAHAQAEPFEVALWPLEEVPAGEEVPIAGAAPVEVPAAPAIEPEPAVRMAL